MRGWRVVAMTVGIVMLLSSLVGVVSGGRERAEHDRDKALSTAARQQASALEAYFERSQALVLTLAASPSFSDFYIAHGPRRQRIAARGRSITDAEGQLRYLEHLYPDSLGEACFIDRGGAENARIVRGVAARPQDLDQHENDNLFFAPTLALPPDTAYQAAPYVSSDTREWVISNSAMVLVEPGARSPGFVHFEVTLESFRQALGSVPGVHLSIVDARTGAVVIDGRDPLRAYGRGEALPALGTGPGRSADQGFAALVRGWGSAGRLHRGGQQLAYQRLATGTHNANHWIVVATAPMASVQWSDAVGAGPIGLVVTALLLLGFALVDSRQHERRLRQLAHQDPLTGLPNRLMFAERLAEALGRASRHGDLIAVLLLDLDRFKEINDTLGHHYGDLLLTAVTDRLARQTGEHDTLARLGGDEFALILTGEADEEGVIRTVRRIQECLTAPFTLDGIAVRVGCSVGIACHPQHALTEADLLRHADVAMYDAKRGGGGYRFYDPQRNAVDGRRIVIAAALPDAVERGEIVLEYQPKIDLLDGRVTSVEALARWVHPELGRVPPDDFIGLAEELGIIGPLTTHIIGEALRQCRRWHEEGHRLTVAVNLSASSLDDSELVSRIGELLSSHDLPAGALELEITENSLMHDPEGAIRVLNELADLGIKLSIDDFGTGYSSLAYLKQLPVHELKIDRGFVTRMNEVTADQFIVDATIDLGHRLGFTIVAEGVEDSEVLRSLADLGCDQAQGYHISRPAPASVISQWLTRRSTETYLPEPRTAGAAERVGEGGAAVGEGSGRPA